MSLLYILFILNLILPLIIINSNDRTLNFNYDIMSSYIEEPNGLITKLDKSVQLHESIYQSENVVEGYAIVLGVSDYPGTEYDLTYCDDDATDLYNLVQSEFKIPRQNIIYLTNSMVTKSAITAAINELAVKMDANDYLFFSFSGHGSCNYLKSTYDWYIESNHPYSNGMDYYWHYSYPGAFMMRVHFTQIETEYRYDGVFVGDNDHRDEAWDLFTGEFYDVWSNWVICDDIYVNLYTDPYSIVDWGFQVDKVQVAFCTSPFEIIPYDGLNIGLTDSELDLLLDLIPGKVICLFDSCHSGGIGSSLQQVGRYIMTACLYDEVSLEDPYSENGVFTHEFLDCWTSAYDFNNDGVKSFEEIWDYLYSGTVSRSNYLGFTHHPQCQDHIVGETILQPNAKILNYNYDVNGTITLNYSHSGLGYGNLGVFYYDLLNNNYFKSYCNMNLISSPGFHQFTVNGPSDSFHISAISIILEARYHDFVETSTIFIEIGSEYVSTVVDSDGDGIIDYNEFTKGSNPWDLDSDNDSFSDYYEYVNNFIPYYNDYLLDLDGDGIPIEWELVYSLSPTEDNTYLDADRDGVSDYLEYINFGNPTKPDTDNDLLNDLQELQLGTLLNDIDSDNDLFTDYTEFILGTNPLNFGFSPFVYIAGIIYFIGGIYFIRSYGKKYAEKNMFKHPKSLKNAPEKTSVEEIKIKRPVYNIPPYIRPYHESSLLKRTSSQESSSENLNSAFSNSISRKPIFCGKCGSLLVNQVCPRCVEKRQVLEERKTTFPELDPKREHILRSDENKSPSKSNIIHLPENLDSNIKQIENKIQNGDEIKEFKEDDLVDIFSWIKTRISDVNEKSVSENEKPLDKKEKANIPRFCPNCGYYSEFITCPRCGFIYKEN